MQNRKQIFGGGWVDPVPCFPFSLRCALRFGQVHALQVLASAHAIFVGICCWGVLACEKATPQDFRTTFSQVSSEKSGVDFIHTNGEAGDRYIVETVLGSLALFDYDGDGYIDIYLVNGAPLPPFSSMDGGSKSVAHVAYTDRQPVNRLYRNHGNFCFQDTTDESGLGDAGYGMGVVVGDVDEDGDPDVFLSNFGSDRLYLNQGDGSFIEATQAVGISGRERFGAGNALFDMDGDSDLDLYCASYVEFDFTKHRTRTIAGKEFHPGPNDYPPAADLLYRNNGDGTFTDVSIDSGIGLIKAPGMGVLATDFDDDRDMDIFVANDQQANFLWINDGSTFREEALFAGVAFDRNGKANGNMAVEYADLNGDGRLDFLTTTYQDEMPVYYQATASGVFTDATNIGRLDASLFAHVKWGSGASDLDNDGDNDIFIACGHFLDNIRAIDDRTDVKVRNVLLENDGKGRFRNVTGSAGEALAVVESSRGAAFDDLDNDGDLDFVVLNINAPATLGRNELNVDAFRGIGVRLIGTTSNRDGVGAKVEMRLPGAQKVMTQVVCAGRGYESHYGSRLHFGVGGQSSDAWPENAIFRVSWPSAGPDETPAGPETPGGSPNGNTHQNVEEFHWTRSRANGTELILIEGTGILSSPKEGL